MGRLSREKRCRRMVPADTEPAWTPFARATVEGQHVISAVGETFSVWKNSRYTVLYRPLDPDEHSIVNVHLSIKRNDRQPIANWRDLQLIKNIFVGKESEAVQLFPAESRLLDTANQYHLWCCDDPSRRLPFGYQERRVSESSFRNSVQEPFEPHTRPDDLDSSTERFDTLVNQYAERLSKTS